jgi:hypothetical protein
VSRKKSETRLGGRAELRSLVGLLPLIVASVLIALVATAAVPASTYCSFQSPVSPVSPVGPTPGQTPAIPTGTVAGPALVAVPVAPNFLPWIIGLVVTAIVVGLVLYWRGRREGGEGSP